MPQRFLAEILEPRAAELCELLHEHLRQAGGLELCNAGVVLTGGGSRLNEVAWGCEPIVGRPVPLASPPPNAKMPAQLAGAGVFPGVWEASDADRSTGGRGCDGGQL